MKLGIIFQSMKSWGKLAAVNMKPAVAYKILKYTKLVSDEFEIIEKQRVALLREITNTVEGEEAKVEQGTPEFLEYVTRFNEVVSQESTLPQINLPFEDVILALDGKDDILSVQDLAMLEPFFLPQEGEADKDA